MITTAPHETGPTIQRLDELSAPEQRRRCRHFYNERRRAAQRGHYPDYEQLLDCQIAALWRGYCLQEISKAADLQGLIFLYYDLLRDSGTPEEVKDLLRAKCPPGGGVTTGAWVDAVSSAIQLMFVGTTILLCVVDLEGGGAMTSIRTLITYLRLPRLVRAELLLLGRHGDASHVRAVTDYWREFRNVPDTVAYVEDEAWVTANFAYEVDWSRVKETHSETAERWAA